MEMHPITIDHRIFNFREFGYEVHPLNQFPIDRRLGTVRYRVVAQTLTSPHKLCESFPIEHEGFIPANPVHLAAFSKIGFHNHGYMFAIGEACQLRKGFLVGELRPGGQAGDAYLPSWVADYADPKCKMNSDGFPVGTKILLVAPVT